MKKVEKCLTDFEKLFFLADNYCFCFFSPFNCHNFERITTKSSKLRE